MRKLRVLLPLLLLLCSACGRRSWAMNEQVEGTVKLDGTPLANVMVQFVPDLDPKVQAPQSSAVTDEKGHFVLTCDNKKPGAVIGKHNVLVLAGRGDNSAPDPDAPPEQAVPKSKRPAVPQAYTVTSRTPLKISVTGDQHTYDLALKSSAGP